MVREEHSSSVAAEDVAVAVTVAEVAIGVAACPTGLALGQTIHLKGCKIKLCLLILGNELIWPNWLIDWLHNE